VFQTITEYVVQGVGIEELKLNIQSHQQAKRIKGFYQPRKAVIRWAL
tara:strand:+ start:527 stop:667 length:141 start_codon:yes stop_codon:yes gene_type:complete